MILVWNCGSSSIKYIIFDQNLNSVASKSFSNLNINDVRSFSDTAKTAILDIKQKFNIKIVAFRVVSAGSSVKDGVEIDEDLIIKIEQESRKILHNLAVLAVIKESLIAFSNVKHHAFFDTSLFNDLPTTAKEYAISKAIGKEIDTQRHGYHGISHRYAISFAKEIQKVISIHLGAGCSAAAFKDGKPIEISMGHSTNEGLIMQSRSGDIDSMLALEIAEKYGIKEAKEILQKSSGLKGMSGLSGEMLEILAASGYEIEDKNYIRDNSFSAETRENSRFALEMFVLRIKKYIGAYAALLNGVDVLIFTGKIGYGSSLIRGLITDELNYLGDFKIITVDPNEELAIAKMVKENFIR